MTTLATAIPARYRRETFDDLFNAIFFSERNVINNSVNTRITKTDEGGFNISLSIPGVNKEDVRILLDKGLISVNYLRPENSDSFVDTFKREWRLDKDSDLNGITAHFNNGVLTISVPRSATAPPLTRQIEIN
jgi:HSP20 family protein